MSLIHRLRGGVTLCGLLPYQFPPHHSWIAFDDQTELHPPFGVSRCPGCFTEEEKVMPVPSMKRARVHVRVELESGEVFESSGEETLINAINCGSRLRLVTEAELHQIDDAVREAVIGYQPKSEA